MALRYVCRNTHRIFRVCKSSSVRLLEEITWAASRIFQVREENPVQYL